MGEADKLVQPEGPRAALDRMDGPEDGVQRLLIAGAAAAGGVNLRQPVGHRFQELLAFLEEGGADV